MEYIVKIIGNVLGTLYQVSGASLVIDVLFMCAYMHVRKLGAGPGIQGWIQEFRTDSLFRRQFFFVLYVCMMLFRTLFCRSIWGHPLENVLGTWGFHTEDGALYTENIENLILFLPFVSLLFWMTEEKKKNKKNPLQVILMRSAAVSFGVSLAIELCQLFLKIGTFQLTDLFFNTVGGVFGGVLYWGFDRCRKRLIKYIRSLGGWDTEVWTPPKGLLDEPKTKEETAAAPENETFAGGPVKPEQEKAVEALMQEAGRKMLEARLGDGAVHEKEGPANFCTDFDMEIQKFLIQGLGKIFPGAEFFGEEETEGNAGASASGEYTFYIDPIDGTTNFMFHYNHSCISVGLAYQGKMTAGFVYNPYVNEMYTAVRGKGSFLNGRKLEIQNRSVTEGITAFGCARYNAEGVDLLFDTVRELFQKSLSIRSGGSAALDLCRIASGANVVYLETRLQPYDYAASSVIVEEAGGVIAQFDGSPITLHKPCSILAGTPQGCSETREIITSHSPH